MATPEQNKRLFEAVIWNSGAEAISELVEAGADLNCEEEFTGRTPLYAACFGDRVQAITALLSLGADPNKRFSYRSPVDGRVEADVVALHYASSQEAVSALLGAGAEVDAVDSNGTTALMHAAFKGKVEVVRALLAAGASPLVRQHKRPRRKSHSARELAESNLELWKKHIAEAKPEKIEATLQRYEVVRSLLLEAESKA